MNATAFLTICAWLSAGAVVGALVARGVYRRAVISAGRAARAPLCTSCPFVSEEQRSEILSGIPTERPPALPLTMLDGSGLRRPV